MTIKLTVEDGTMPEGANTYADMDFVNAYLASRGVAGWAEADADSRAAALIRAADVLNSYYWKGETAEPGRVMTWPRKGMCYAGGVGVPENSVPVQVQNAQCEIAGAVIAGDTDPLAQVDTAKGAVTSEKVDVIGVSYTDPSTNSYSGKTGYPAVDGLLRPFLGGMGGGFGIVELGRG